LFSLVKVGKTTANKPTIITCINLQAQTAQGIPSSISICVVWNAAWHTWKTSKMQQKDSLNPHESK